MKFRKIRFVVHVRFFGKVTCIYQVLSENQKSEFCQSLKVKIETYFTAIESGVSTGFDWLSIENFRAHHCTRLSDALRL